LRRNFGDLRPPVVGRKSPKFALRHPEAPGRLDEVRVAEVDVEVATELVVLLRDGVVVLPARLLLNVVRSLPADQVSLVSRRSIRTGRFPRPPRDHGGAQSDRRLELLAK
jgi:hypothetical protein